MRQATTRRRHIDLATVRAAIEQAERRTSAELVVSVAPFFLGSVVRAARRAFVRLEVARTQARNGVLVFVVPARRQVVILPDDGARARIDDGVWRAIAGEIAAAFGEGRGTQGLVDGIARLADALAPVFPRAPDDINELPDQPELVELAAATIRLVPPASPPRRG